MYTLALDAYKRHLDNNGILPVKENEEYLMRFCNKMGIEPDILYNKSRRPLFVRYRSLFCNWVGLNSVELAELLNMNHSSIIHLRKTHEERLFYDNKYKILHRRLIS